MLSRSLVNVSGWYWLRAIALPLAGATMLSLGIGYTTRFFLEASFLRVCLTTIMSDTMFALIAWFCLFDKDERLFVTSRIKAVFVSAK